jgi:undecaprenyl-diphosphatase
MDNITIFAAEYLIALPVIVLLYLLFAARKDEKVIRKAVFVLILSGILAYVLAKIGNHLIDSPRPFVVGHFEPLIGHSTDNGFPSEHTLLAASLAWSIRVLSKRFSYAMLVVALLVGLARMAAGVHHSWDILGSFVFATIAYYVTVWVYDWWRARHKPVTE